MSKTFQAFQMTFKQAKEQGYNIQKGAKGIQLERWIWEKQVPKLDEQGNPVLDENGKVIHISKGECHGEIMTEPSGTNGFGYDPIFRPDGYDITIAQMSEDEKNSISNGFFVFS